MMNAKKILTLCAAVFALGALSPLYADEPYQYIVSGYPAANQSYSAQSAAVALYTGTLSTSAEAQPLEARYRTWLASEGTSLISTLLRGFKIIFR